MVVMVGSSGLCVVPFFPASIFHAWFSVYPHSSEYVCATVALFYDVLLLMTSFTVPFFLFAWCCVVMEGRSGGEW
jgi:hypothetical protein